MKLMKMIVATGLVAVGAPAFAQEQLSIATGGTGGVYYPMGGAIAEVINNNVEGYQATAEVTGASVENMGLIATGDADIAFGLADTVEASFAGSGPFEGQQLPMIRAIASVYANNLQLVVPADSDIASLADLAGKRVSVGAPGSGTEVNVQTVLEANGVTYDDFEVQRLNFNETADALANGDIDAGFWSVGAPTSSIMNLATTNDVKMLSLTDEERANAIEANGIYAETTIASGTYEGIAEDVQTIGIPNVLAVSSEMPEEVAYNVTKAMFDNVADMQAVHPAANETTVEFTMSATPVPLHPGAIRYFEEAGAEIPDDLRE
ncbi:TAXI family TRAP transporter solute-binding subunit [Paracoccaceae bacterium GXU_MW_L88]